MGSQGFGSLWTSAQTNSLFLQDDHPVHGPPAQCSRQETRCSHFTPATVIRLHEAIRRRLCGRGFQQSCSMHHCRRVQRPRIHGPGLGTALGRGWPRRRHLWATNLPRGTRAVLRSDAAQSRRLLKATTKNERKRQRRRDQATTHEAGQTTSTASVSKLWPASPARPAYPYDVFQ